MAAEGRGQAEQRRKNLERRQEQAIEDKSKLLKNIEAAADLKLFPLSMEIRKGDRIAEGD